MPLGPLANWLECWTIGRSSDEKPNGTDSRHFWGARREAPHSAASGRSPRLNWVSRRRGYLDEAMATRRTFLIPFVLGVLAVSGCSSSPSTTATTATTQPSATAASPPTSSASGTTGSTLFSTGPVPAVTGATDLSKQPVVVAGAAPAPTTLTGMDLVVGTGATAGTSGTVKVQYVGALYSTGKVFDASWTDNGAATFPLSGVIPGFRNAIIGMRVGGRREVVIPPTLGYGAAGSPPAIPPNATLVFVIDLLAVS
jgi:peptidylprolyl isomerase